MTLAFLGRVGGTAYGDPPAAWLMPLAGDAVIGLGALVVSFMLWRRTRGAWATALAFHVVAAWDALSAYLIHLTVPWPTFFMVERLGSSMFFGALAMHTLCIVLLVNRQVRSGPTLNIDDQTRAA